ncbi:MAG: branched-chain amino acid ABC transporter permease [Deltaproteobacteria bacterium]|nr:branched-chain amino acid ABC transporter permease [Deltaproteobacteria bacterium]
MPSRLRPTPLLLALAFLAFLAVPAFQDESMTSFCFRLLELVAMTYSLNLITGYLGYVDFGHIVFYGVGAYTTALLLSGGVALHPALLILPGGAAALLFGLLAGYPALRLRGAYFAIATFSINEAMKAVVLNVDWLGGSEGIPLARYIRLELTTAYYVLLGIAAAVAAFSYTAVRQKFGLGMLAIREDEDVAEALAIDTTRYKLLTYALSGAVAGLAGGIVGLAHVYVSTEYFDVGKSIEMFVIMMLGGAGTALGPLLGAFLYFLIKDFLILRSPHLHQIIFGLIIVFIVLFLPAGLVGYLRERSGRLRALLE